MGADAAINLIFQLLGTAWSAAKNAGLVGSPNWAKYADAGLFLAQRAAIIIKDIVANPSKYDKATPEQIKGMLLPLTWDEIEAQAAAELAQEKHQSQGLILGMPVMVPQG